jgi:uncharacterized protein YlxW (UPF0749 family)
MEQTTNDLWESFIKEQQEEETLDGSIREYEQDIKKMMIEFAKMHIEKIMNLQQSKYYAGETGYITKKEWQDLLNVK